MPECGSELRIASELIHLLGVVVCEAVEDEQSAANRNQVFGNGRGEVWHMCFDDHKMTGVITGKCSDDRADRGKQR